MLTLLLLAAPVPLAVPVEVRLRVLKAWELPAERAGLTERLADGSILSPREFRSLLEQMQGQVEGEVMHLPLLRCPPGKPAPVEMREQTFIVLPRLEKKAVRLEISWRSDGGRVGASRAALLEPGMALVFPWKGKLVMVEAAR